MQSPSPPLRSLSFTPPRILNTHLIKQERKIGYPQDSNQGFPDQEHVVINNNLEPAEWEPPLREPKVQLIIWSLKKFSTPIHKVLKETWKHLTSLKLWKRSQIPHPSPRVASTSNRTKINHYWLNHQQTIHVYTHTHTHTTLRHSHAKRLREAHEPLE